MSDLEVFRGRTNVVMVNLGYDASNDTFTSEIREGKTSLTPLIATWDVDFLTDGTDGKLVLTLDDSVNIPEDKTAGYTDIKRVSGGEPLPVFDAPVKVKFKDTVTA